jgi:hypothetical protein
MREGECCAGKFNVWYCTQISELTLSLSESSNIGVATRKDISLKTIFVNTEKNCITGLFIV